MDKIDQALNNFRDEDWDPWILSSNVDFKIGDLFILDIFGNLDPMQYKNSIYKCAGLPIGKLKTLPMELYHQNPGIWVGSHNWEMNYSTSRIRMFKHMNKTNSIIQSVNGYNCKKCNIHNKWAASNLPNNEYICFECR